MAKGIYVGVDNIARKVKKAYVGVDGVARKVTKGYIGVGGVARPFFSGEKKLVRYGNTSGLSVARSALAGTSVGDYALFGGGYTSAGKRSNVVDTYSKDLVKGTASNLTTNDEYPSASSTPSMALFCSGYNGSYLYYGTAYNANLVKSTFNSTYTAGNRGATNVGDYVIFAGGAQGTSPKANTDARDSNLTNYTVSALSVAQNYIKGTSVGDYALFGGGYYSSSNVPTTIDTYDKNLVKGTASNLSVPMYQGAATSVGDYALFAGGRSRGTQVDTYDKNLVKGTASNLSLTRYYVSATSIGDYAIFAGGYSRGSVNNVDVYDKNLVKQSIETLTTAKYSLAGATAGDYALFAGGYSTDETTNVCVYQLV